MVEQIEKGISIHAPRTGSDVGYPEVRTKLEDFNPRSPHGERPTACWFSFYDMDISIHAPRTGSDGKPLPADHVPLIFQSTLPARGATLNPLEDNGRVIISIHAPRTGSDKGFAPGMEANNISIHAPRTGSDLLSAGGCPA